MQRAKGKHREDFVWETREGQLECSIECAEDSRAKKDRILSFKGWEHPRSSFRLLLKSRGPLKGSKQERPDQGQAAN